MPAASAEASRPPSEDESSPGIAGSNDNASGVGKSPSLLSNTHCAAPATRAIDTCLLPAVGDSSDETDVLPYAEVVIACACDVLTPTDAMARTEPSPLTLFGFVVAALMEVR